MVVPRTGERRLPDDLHLRRTCEELLINRQESANASDDDYDGDHRMLTEQPLDEIFGYGSL